MLHESPTPAAPLAAHKPQLTEYPFPAVFCRHGEPQHRLRITNAPKILMLNALHDPPTAYEWAVNAHRQSRNATVLLTYEGWGHGVYDRSDCTRGHDRRLPDQPDRAAHRNALRRRRADRGACQRAGGRAGPARRAAQPRARLAGLSSAHPEHGVRVADRPYQREIPSPSTGWYLPRRPVRRLLYAVMTGIIGGVHELLRSVWDEPRPAHPPQRVWRDWVLVGVPAPVALLEGLLRQDLASPAVSVLVTVGLLPTLLWRRTRPLMMVVIAFGVCAAAPLVSGHEPELNTLVYMLLLPYSLLRWGSGREVVVGAGVITGKLVLSTALGYLSLTDSSGGLLIVSAAAALGAAARYRARARLRELDQVKLLERERLARDLHDTVAHHVSAMAIRAQAGLATMPSDPDAPADALRLIEAEASRALAEMRTMVRALRRYEPNEPAELTVSARVCDLTQLAGTARGGPVVDVEIDGEVDDLPPPVAAAIYRLVQESVTNACRHARHATRIEVRVAADDTSVRLRVSDDGELSLVRPNGSGYGLIGMIERADLLGGTCEAGPNLDRGWTVSAVLPRTGVAA